MLDKIINRAEEMLEDSLLAIERGQFRFAVDRAYLAAYHACNLFLYPNRFGNTDFEEVLTEFNDRIISKNLLPLSFKVKFEELAETRIEMDFGSLYDVPKEKSVMLFQYAKDFLDAAKEVLENQPA